MGNPDSEKAARYVGLLNEARCNAHWQELPELARKVEKHAPNRRCLALTARTEAQISSHTDRRPGTATSASAPGLAKLIPSLVSAIEQETEHKQDAFQASICLGWLHWTLDEPKAAIDRLPRDFAKSLAELKRGEDLTGWTRVCLFKGAYLKGLSQEKSSTIPEAIQTYTSLLPYLSSLDSITTASPELQKWVDWLLSRLCLLSDQTAPSGSIVPSSQALRAFRLWVRLFEQKPGQFSAAAVRGTSASISPRRRVLKSYYDTLSIILQQNLPYSLPTTINSNMRNEKSEMNPEPRFLQRAELKRVETLYETQLLNEMHFPKATQSNNEVELWVDSVMQNWRVFCGPTWRDEELGEGAKPAVAREVLDILYRAATKTFHSTQILRYLFTVHASLAEFDLAFKAFDSYVELVTRSKDRSEKSGDEDSDVDDDDTIIRTTSEAIRVLCRFGSRKEAAKAREVARVMERWLQQKKSAPLTTNPSSTHSRKSTAESIKIPTETTLSPKARSVAFRAIGLSQAQWARYTYDASSRASLQSDAAKNLRKALEPELEDSNNLETHYALGLVLAEMRDVSGAIRVVKHALSSGTQQESSFSPDGVMSDSDPSQPSTDFVSERKLIPLWHLLSLLLTARSEPNTAVKACEAAFDQFEDPEILYGSGDEYRSAHLTELIDGDEKHEMSSKGLVDEMESFEKEGILQTKVTQLAVIEALDGPGVAVASCNELVSLFGRLFPDVQPIQARAPTPQIAKPPKSSAGTVRGSIFRRHRASRSNLETPSNLTEGRSAPSALPSSTPAIRVTGDKSSTKPNGNRDNRNVNGKESVPQRTASKLQKKNSASLHRKSSESVSHFPDHEADTSLSYALDGQANSIHSGKHKTQHSLAGSLVHSANGTSGQPLSNISHNLPHNDQPPPSGHSKQPPKQDARLPSKVSRLNHSPPEPRFSILQEKRHKMSLLTSVWLFIAELYCRAELYEDAKEAIAEAADIVKQLEDVVASDSSSSQATTKKGWGGGKSVDELWGDVNAARGYLTHSQSRPYEALQDFERALLHFPDHPTAIVGLSNILLDIYSEKIPQEPSIGTGMLTPSTGIKDDGFWNISKGGEDLKTTDFHKHQSSLSAPSAANRISPSELNRLAARDRAYGLLSALTKLGSGWDYSEAWFTLARAYELSEQIEKAKEVLWWCVELEDAKPIRHWSAVGNGGTIL